MFENPRRGRQARNFKTNVPKILVLKSSSEQIFSRKLPLGAPESHFFKEANITSCKTSYNVLTKPIILVDWVHLCLGGRGKGLVDIKGG